MTLKTTPLFNAHQRLGARIVEFAGFRMPVQYSGVIKEHMNTRENVSLFDVSHMGEIMVEGPGATDLLQHLTSNDVSKLYEGRAQYSMLMNEKGGVIDDIIIYKISDNRYFICVNAANTEKDFLWIKEHSGSDTRVTNVSDDFAQIAVQGPRSIAFLEEITNLPLSRVKFYHFIEDTFPGNVRTIFSRTGYTGEPGFELYLPPDRAEEVWFYLLERGRDYNIMPAGLGARDTLRLEMGYPLYGHELTDDTTPLEAGLHRFVKIDKGDFIGRDILVKQLQDGLRRKLYPILMTDRGIPREGYEVKVNGEKKGVITSGTMSPVLKKGIALAYIEDTNLQKTDPVAIIIRKKDFNGVIWETPFVKKR